MWQRQYEGGTQYFQIPEDARVLIVENSLHRLMRFREMFPFAKFAMTATDAIEILKHDNTLQWVFLDRDLANFTYGESVAEFCVSLGYKGRVVCHSANDFGAKLIKKILEDAAIPVQVCPFEMVAIVRVPCESAR